MKSTQQKEHEILRTKLERVMERSKQNRDAQFNNLGHIIDLELLRQCYLSLDGSKATGIDGVTKEEYGKELDKSLQELLLKIRRGSYHPKASRIVEIPKIDGSTRPLAISCTEDKIVQEAVRRVLESIYEPIFREESHGFRPGKGCETALLALDKAIMKTKCGAVLEIDLRKYFNTIPHEPLEKMLRIKIKDERFLYVVLKLLKAPVMGADGKQSPSKIGSPQGSIVSPIIANIYLHYVLDVWFAWINRKQFEDSARLVRYADDCVFTFRTIGEAESFLKVLTDRFTKSGITLHEGKTKILLSGQVNAARMKKLNRKMPAFTFLGFLHVWGQAMNRKTCKTFWRIKRRTDPVRMTKKLLEIKEYIKSHRHDKDLLMYVKSVVTGYLNYFAINDNSKRATLFLKEVRRMLFKWLNRRSQKRSYNWAKFIEILNKIQFPSRIKIRNVFFDMSVV